MTDTATKLTMQSEITGAEFRDFFLNHWPKDWYGEDIYPQIENEEGDFILPDDARLRLDNIGWAGWQGEGRRQSVPIGELYLTFAESRQGTVVVAFRVPAARAEELAAAAAALGAAPI